MRNAIALAGCALSLASATLLVGVSAWPSAESAAIPAKRAFGAGTIEIERDHDRMSLRDDAAIGMFDFEVVKRGRDITGRLEFAAEDHGEGLCASSNYPHIVFTLEAIDSAEFTRRRVEFAGTGFLHQHQPVKFAIEAVDSATEGGADTFTITFSDETGEVYNATGECFIGSLTVQSGS